MFHLMYLQFIYFDKKAAFIISSIYYSFILTTRWLGRVAPPTVQTRNKELKKRPQNQWDQPTLNYAKGGSIMILNSEVNFYS